MTQMSLAPKCIPEAQCPQVFFMCMKVSKKMEPALIYQDSACPFSAHHFLLWLLLKIHLVPIVKQISNPQSFPFFL